ncbi:MAG: hypothetical protein ACREF4_02435, partial [Gammaproteobacteria bacterium]
MSSLPPDEIARAIDSPRWAGLVRLDLDLDQVAHWDPSLIRQPRVLVPVDVQALFVENGSTEKFVRLPFALTSPDGVAPEPMPSPFDAGVARAPGVHLHWAPPDALMRGNLEAVEDGSSNRLGLGVLPDRWVVLRILAPNGVHRPHVRGWVIEADAARAVPLESWPSGSAGFPQEGRTLLKNELTGTAGGTLNWAAVYDAVRNRLAFHDPLDDVKAVAPNGVFGNSVTYIVAGWWSDPTLDPLDGAQTTSSLHDRMDGMRWRLTDDREGGHALPQNAAIAATMRETLGVETGARYAQNVAQPKATSTLRAAPADVALEKIRSNVHAIEATHSVFVDEVSSAVATEPRWPRTTLLHGVVHGVPVTGGVKVDQRPAASLVRAAFGRHMDDVVSTLAATELSAASPDARRALERTLAAFTGQLLPRLGTDDGVVDIDEHEHAAGFEALPGGPGAEERLLPAGEAGPLAAGRGARSALAMRQAATKAKGRDDANLVFSRRKKTSTTSGGKAEARRQKEARRTQTSAAPSVEARNVRRPAPRYHRPLEPMIALSGAHRSLRHGSDGRFSADYRLQCRWPTQVGPDVQGVVEGASLIPSLASGAIPEEILGLARNALVTDPYLAPWIADATSKRRGIERGFIENRLAAEAALRFGVDGTYDGQAAALVEDPRARALAGARIADQLRRFSLVAGVDADPVGVTAWSQPWVPLWLEWEASLDGTDRLEAWRLDAVDLDVRDENAPPAGAPLTFAGRSALHTGAAVALAAAIDEWKVAEDALDRDNQGEADEATETALSNVADAIERLDLVTASLEGLHARLLGLPVGDFGVLHERNGGGTIAQPVPADVPRLLAEGILRIGRLRVIDAFGRTLDLPVSTVRVPARDEVSGVTATLRARPRLLRPARWLFRLVNPADLAITSPEATIDQVEPASMINPVAGFMLPDHIDEALEFFDTAGTPLGQLMHEPFGGGVVWEIAPGREGPYDAGPHHGLQPAQQVLGLAAAALVAVDAETRGGQPLAPDKESALSALLRAIDTTLWTVDTFAGLGTEHIAGLVGRPIAVVRAV